MVFLKYKTKAQKTKKKKKMSLFTWLINKKT